MADFVYTQLNVKTVLLQTIQFSISIDFSSIWPIDRTLSSAATPCQNWPGSIGNEDVLHIPQSSSITEASPSDCLVSSQDTRLGSLTPLQRCSQCILHPQPTGPKNNVCKIITEGLGMFENDETLCAEIWQFLDEGNITIKEQPPYSPSPKEPGEGIWGTRK